ncbi:MAG: methylmalonyl Co-A mutase-associated GTPase MeaB [Thermodesulfobacteriota bacterium]
MKGIQPEEYINGVLAGNRRMIAKAITLVESSLPEHKKAAGQVLEGLLPHSGKSIRVGVTGVPGVGKSVFIEALGTHLTAGGSTVAVLAVDPSSVRSGGSVLGDKTRMEKLAADPRAYIRPSPSGKTLGGIAAKTREDILVCEAAGYEIVIVETVGVGQSETAVAGMVDFFLVLMLAGAGDELQGIKKGILELADAVVVTKADGENVANAERAAKNYETALHMLAPTGSAWHPPVLTCSALTGIGIDQIWQVIRDHQAAMMRTGEFEKKRSEQNTRWMWNLIEEGIRAHFLDLPEVRDQLQKITRQVADGEITAAGGAGRLLFYLDKRSKT